MTTNSPSTVNSKEDASHPRSLDQDDESQVFREEDKLSVAIETSLSFLELTSWLSDALGSLPSGERVLVCHGIPSLARKPFLYRVTLPNSALFSKLLAFSSILPPNILHMGPWAAFPASGTLLIPLLAAKSEAVRKAVSAVLTRWSGTNVSCTQEAHGPFTTGCWKISAVFPTPKTRPLKPLQVVVKVKKESISCTLVWDVSCEDLSVSMASWKRCARHWWGKPGHHAPTPAPASPEQPSPPAYLPQLH